MRKGSKKDKQKLLRAVREYAEKYGFWDNGMAGTRDLFKHAANHIVYNEIDTDEIIYVPEDV